MLTTIQVDSQWSGVPSLGLSVINPREGTLLEVRNIDGLGSVKADVNTTPLGSIRGAAPAGSNTGTRNIVLTLGLNPDWNDWTISRLRRLLDKYFIPEQRVRMVFETMEFSPVEISGTVESNEPNMFSKDPEHQISIICEKPDFVSVDEVFVDGYTDEDAHPIDYEGNIETGVLVQVQKIAGDVDANTVILLFGDPAVDVWQIDSAGIVSDTSKLEVSSFPGNKHVDALTTPAGVEIHTSRLNDVVEGSKWPTIRPGVTSFQVLSNAGRQYWYMTYKNVFGSL